jgi:hypothetical protein
MKSLAASTSIHSNIMTYIALKKDILKTFSEILSFKVSKWSRLNTISTYVESNVIPDEKQTIRLSDHQYLQPLQLAQTEYIQLYLNIILSDKERFDGSSDYLWLYNNVDVPDLDNDKIEAFIPLLKKYNRCILDIDDSIAKYNAVCSELMDINLD